MQKAIFLWMGLLCYLFYPASADASDFSDRVGMLAKVEGIRVYTDGDSRVRIVLDTSKAVQYKTFILSNPTRVAIDIKGAWLSPSAAKDTPVVGGLVGKVRVSQFDPETVRVVVEANVSKDMYKIFSLKADASADKLDRIVMDFGDLAQVDTAKIPVTEDMATIPSTAPPVVKTVKLFDEPGLKGKVIAVDPGHGGSDSGAVGPGGAYEKNITLSIALKLREMLEEAGATVVMTREKDIDVAWANATAVDELQARVDVANKVKADVFVSIHMDSFVSQQAKGTSTYIYEKTNGDARIGQFVKEELVGQLGTVDRDMRTSNFYVVKHTKMPATLAEIAFISNADEERMMTSGEGVKKAATGIYRGLDRYFSYE